jgi:glycine cleavage system H protein
MWCQSGPDGIVTFGFSAYAVRLMQDVYFLEWRVDAESHVSLRQEVGFVETQKATSALYAPAAGRVVRFNPAVLADPGLINVDCYGRGWLFELAGDPADALDAGAYHAHLAAGWEATQRLLKGQISAAD